MVEREEKLIKKIIKLQKEQNSLKLDEQIENYKKEIKEADKILEKTKSEIGRLSHQLNELKNKNENNNSDIEQNIENKKEELEKKLRENEMKKNQLDFLQKSNENFKNEEYILELIKYWNPQTMFKYIELYDKKPE